MRRFFSICVIQLYPRKMVSGTKICDERLGLDIEHFKQNVSVIKIVQLSENGQNYSERRLFIFCSFNQVL